MDRKNVVSLHSPQAKPGQNNMVEPKRCQNQSSTHERSRLRLCWSLTCLGHNLGAWWARPSWNFSFHTRRLQILASWHFCFHIQKYFNFVAMLESRNVDHMKSNCLWDMFCEKIQADFTLSQAFQKYFNFVPMLESLNVDHVKSNCSWDMFLLKNSGGLHTFMSFTNIFQLCTHARITKCRSCEK